MARAKMVKTCQDLTVRVHIGRSVVILCDDQEVLEMSLQEAFEFEKKLHLALAAEIAAMLFSQEKKENKAEK